MFWIKSTFYFNLSNIMELHKSPKMATMNAAMWMAIILNSDRGRDEMAIYHDGFCTNEMNTIESANNSTDLTQMELNNLHL